MSPATIFRPGLESAAGLRNARLASFAALVNGVLSLYAGVNGLMTDTSGVGPMALLALDAGVWFLLSTGYRKHHRSAAVLALCYQALAFVIHPELLSDLWKLAIWVIFSYFYVVGTIAVFTLTTREGTAPASTRSGESD